MTTRLNIDPSTPSVRISDISGLSEAVEGLPYDQGLNAEDNVTFNGVTVSGFLVPNVDNIVDIGTPAKRFKNVLSYTSSADSMDATSMSASRFLLTDASKTAFGNLAGSTGQGNLTVAVGHRAGETTQGFASTAVGDLAGRDQQGPYAVAVGQAAGETTQGQLAVAIGFGAGTASQGERAVAIGASAAPAIQPADSIAINASNAPINPAASNEILMRAGTTEFKQDANGFYIPDAVGAVNNFRVGNASFVNAFLQSDGANGTRWVPTPGGNTLTVLTEQNLIDHKPLVGGEHVLDDGMNYFISGLVLFVNPIRIPLGATAGLHGHSTADALVFAGSGALFRGTKFSLLKVNTLAIACTGGQELFSVEGDAQYVPPFQANVVIDNVVVNNFVTMGQIKQSGTVSLHTMFVLQSSLLQFISNANVSMRDIVFQSGFETSYVLQFGGLLGRCGLNNVIHIPTKQTSLIDINPIVTITPDSAFFITDLPYPGLVKYAVSGYSAAGGDTQITIVGDHTFENGDSVLVSNSPGYDGIWEVSNVTHAGTSGTFVIDVGFGAATPTVGVVTLLDGATPWLTPLFRPPSLSGTITGYAVGTLGANYTKIFTSPSTLLANDFVRIRGDRDGAYDGNYLVAIVAVDGFEIQHTFTTDDAQGEWDNGSLDQTDPHVSVANSIGIVPNSTINGNIKSQNNFSRSLTNTRTHLTSGTWSAFDNERTKSNYNTGRIRYIGAHPTNLTVSAYFSVKKASGSTETIFCNVAPYNDQGNLLAIPFFPDSSARVEAATSTTVTCPARSYFVQPGQQIGAFAYLGTATPTTIIFEEVCIAVNGIA
jgi:hypothetical protein